MESNKLIKIPNDRNKQEVKNTKSDTTPNCNKTKNGKQVKFCSEKSIHHCKNAFFECIKG